MAFTVQNCCFLIAGAVLGTLLRAALPHLLRLFPFRSLAFLARGVNQRCRPGARPWAPLEELPLEILEQVLFHCHADDVARVALASPRLAYLTRRYRWSKVSVQAGEPYYSFREWSLQAAMTGTQSLRSLQIVIPGLDITFPLCRELRRDFSDFVRQVAFPSRWSPESLAFLAVVAGLAPASAHTVVLGSSTNERSWWSTLQRVWVPSTMDAMIARARVLRFVNATRGGLHFALSRRVSGTIVRVSEVVHTVEIKHTTDSPEWHTGEDWSDLGWGSVAGPEAEVDTRVKAKALHVDMANGVLRLLQHLYFPCLTVLVFDLGYFRQGEWDVISRLLRDSASTLTELGFFVSRLGNSGLAGHCSIDDLPLLQAVRTDWKALAYLPDLQTRTRAGVVEMFVDGYFATIATTDDVNAACRVLRGGHWGRITFFDTPFLRCSDNEDFRRRRHADLMEMLQIRDLSFD
ncbi:uncharacterized protein SCHCODRAFT_01206529 [Schizophyllum commune H4-8]|nr:uncharacterized protein SCHCODRAFT_01206529 [Schizophyllum commune H4-8]KAI5885601.1 hypothetical protein SCHCODRAFT_01206529 [Schizophyllum commune H4-8]